MYTLTPHTTHHIKHTARYTHTHARTHARTHAHTQDLPGHSPTIEALACPSEAALEAVAGAERSGAGAEEQGCTLLGRIFGKGEMQVGVRMSVRARVYIERGGGRPRMRAHARK